jgi:hypothetical protein
MMIVEEWLIRNVLDDIATGCENGIDKQTWKRRTEMRHRALHLIAACMLGVSSFLTCSCVSSPTKMYSGPDLPVNETALIRGALSGIVIETCDGAKISSSAIIVLPGNHIVEMSYNLERGDGGRSYSNENCFMAFTAEAGHVYNVDRTISGGYYHAFIEDQTTGRRVVSGCTVQAAQAERKLMLSERSIKYQPRNATPWFNKGVALTLLKRYDEAIVAFDTAISLQSNLVGAWYWKGRALYESKRYQEALVCLSTAASLTPNVREIIQLRESVLKDIGGSDRKPGQEDTPKTE